MTRTRTGRQASKPNLQNFPLRTPEVQRLRSAFLLGSLGPLKKKPHIRWIRGYWCLFYSPESEREWPWPRVQARGVRELSALVAAAKA